MNIDEFFKRIHEDLENILYEGDTELNCSLDLSLNNSDTYTKLRSSLDNAFHENYDELIKVHISFDNIDLINDLVKNPEKYSFLENKEKAFLKFSNLLQRMVDYISNEDNYKVQSE